MLSSKFISPRGPPLQSPPQDCQKSPLSPLPLTPTTRDEKIRDTYWYILVIRIISVRWYVGPDTCWYVISWYVKVWIANSKGKSTLWNIFRKIFGIFSLEKLKTRAWWLEIGLRGRRVFSSFCYQPTSSWRPSTWAVSAMPSENMHLKSGYWVGN